MKKIISVILVLSMLLGTMSACSNSVKKDYMLKGEFFSLVMSEMNYYPIDNTVEEMQKTDNYDIEAKTMVDWGLLSEEEAFKKTDAPITKEIALVILVNSLKFAKVGSIDTIKDAKMCDYPQQMANAVETGLASLDGSGCINAKQKLTCDECDALVKKAISIEKEGHFEDSGTVGYDFGENTVVLSDADIPAGESIEVNGYKEAKEALEADGTTEAVSSVREKPTVSTLELDCNDVSLKETANGSATFDVFVSDRIYENKFKNVEVGAKIVYDATMNDPDYNGNESVGGYKTLPDPLTGSFNQEVYQKSQEKSSFAGELIQKPKLVTVKEGYRETKRWKLHLKAISNQEIMANTNVIDVFKEISKLNLQPISTDIPGVGFHLEAETKGNGMICTISKKFDIQEKINNTEKKLQPELTYSFEVNDFLCDITNIKYFFRGDEPSGIEDELTCRLAPVLKVTWNSVQKLKYSTGELTLTPDNNRNGGAKANILNALGQGLKSTASTGAQSIKLFDFSFNVYGFTFVFYVLLNIKVDGTIEITLDKSGNGFEFLKQNGQTTIRSLESKDTTEVDIKVNFDIAPQLELTVLFALTLNKPIITAFLELALVGAAKFHGYKGENTEISAEELQNDNEIDEWHYCLDLNAQLHFRGGLKIGPSIKSARFSGNSLINDVGKIFGLDIGKAVFDIPLPVKFGLHFEDGAFVDKCTRNPNKEEKEESDNKDEEAANLGCFIMENTKEIMNVGDVRSNSIKGIPISGEVLKEEYRGEIMVEVKNRDIANAWYDSARNCIYITGYEKGSTEVEVFVKDNGSWFFGLWAKKHYSQTISVTVEEPAYSMSDYEVNGVMADFNSIPNKVFTI